MVPVFGMIVLGGLASLDRLWGQEKKEAMPEPTVKVGDMAPDFTLRDTHGKQVSLHDFRGKKNVALASMFSNNAWAEKIGVTFPLLSDWGGEVTKEYGLYNPQYKAARRVNYLIDKSGKVVELQLDSEAIDPTKIVTLCERRKTSGN
jgi:peroxiredoxin